MLRLSSIRWACGAILWTTSHCRVRTMRTGWTELLLQHLSRRIFKCETSSTWEFVPIRPHSQTKGRWRSGDRLRTWQDNTKSNKWSDWLRCEEIKGSSAKKGFEFLWQMSYSSQRAVKYRTVLDEKYEQPNLNVQNRQYRQPLNIILSSTCFPSLNLHPQDPS